MQVYLNYIVNNMPFNYVWMKKFDQHKLKSHTLQKFN